MDEQCITQSDKLFTTTPDNDRMPFDYNLVDPALRALDDAQRQTLRSNINTPIEAPDIIYDSFRNLSSLNQPPPTFSSSPALEVLRGTMKEVK
jgi:hypothetical protein